MNTTRFLSDFNRIFGAGYVRRADDCVDIEAQIEIESGTRFRAAVTRPALCTEASPTRTDNAIGDGND